MLISGDEVNHFIVFSFLGISVFFKKLSYEYKLWIMRYIIVQLHEHTFWVCDDL